MVTSRGNILHVTDVIEEHCTLYKLLDLGFISSEKCSSENKEEVNGEGVLTGKQADCTCSFSNLTNVPNREDKL